MNLNGKNTAFTKLLEYEKRSAQFSPGAGNSGASSDEWSGVTFSVGDVHMACNIDRIGEILPCPQSTPVPGAKSWIVGLANVRGELLTVVDLAWFLTGSRSPITARSRLLSTSLNKAPLGLLIDEVFGQRHFLDSDAVPVELDEDKLLGTIISKQHNLGSESWKELDLEQLFHTAEFLNGSAI
jgi:twitching motility protein PilI